MTPRPSPREPRPSSPTRKRPRRRTGGILPSPLLPLAVVILLFLGATTSASLIGDEDYQRLEGGAFWVFTSEGVSIVDPRTCRIDHSFHTDAAGKVLPKRWSKGAYMQVVDTSKAGSSSDNLDDDIPLISTATTPPTTTTTSPNQAYVLINSGETGEVVVLDPTSSSKQPALATRIAVGGSPGNAYAVYHHNQFWSHSEDDGYFYVIDLESELESHTGHPIRAKMTTAHRSHLLWQIGTTSADDQDDIGYATNAGEPVLTILDLNEHKTTATYDFSPDTLNQTCIGGASMAYSAVNRHLYVECTGGPGGTLEFDVSRPKTPLFVKQHVHISGTLRETPDQDYVTATDKGANAMHFFAPQTTGAASTDPYKITVDGHPEAPTFYENTLTFDYVACMPLTTNTNQNHVVPTYTLNDDGVESAPVACDYFNGCSPALSQADVDRGMCRYRSGADNTAPQGPLLTATENDVAQILGFAEPFGRACDRCAQASAYTSANPTCTCTPQCGTCADDNYPDEPDHALLMATGVRCVDTKDALLGVSSRAGLIPGAGAIKQKAKSIPDPACGFAEPVRPHKRGGNYYDASISTVPYNQLVIVDMRIMDEKCKVTLPGEPQELVYVPTSFHYKSRASSSSSSNADDLTPAAITIIVIAAIFVFGLIVMAAVCFGCKSSFESKSLDVSNPDQSILEMTHNGKERNGEAAVATTEPAMTKEEEGTFVIGDPPTPEPQSGHLA